METLRHVQKVAKSGVPYVPILDITALHWWYQFSLFYAISEFIPACNSLYYESKKWFIQKVVTCNYIIHSMYESSLKGDNFLFNIFIGKKD